jgi:hypothetical protein
MVQRDQNGYAFCTFKIHESIVACTDNIATLTCYIKAIQLQVNKIQKFNIWTGMDLSLPKSTIAEAPNKSKMTSLTFKAFIPFHRIVYNNKPVPILHQNEMHKYIGIQLKPSSK